MFSRVFRASLGPLVLAAFDERQDELLTDGEHVGISLAEALQQRQRLVPPRLVSRPVQGPGQLQGPGGSWGRASPGPGPPRSVAGLMIIFLRGENGIPFDQASNATIEASRSGLPRFLGQLSRDAATPAEIRAPIRSRCWRFSNRPVNVP